MGCYNADVASDSSLAQMYKWITECHSTHTLCQQTPLDFRPRRLLQLDFSKDNSSIRLVENFQGRQIQWAALSYVWGGEQSFKTTLHSLPDMERGFRAEVLPQTLQDAVRVCKAMSLHYLWVDSLCIVQDDFEELPHELASMPLIYQRAWVTISASTAACVSDGFLQNRCYSHWGGCPNTRVPISLPYLAEDGFGTGKIVFVHASDACSSKAEPINERAWTYQERTLSPRVLDFRYNQVVLCCYTNTRCQGQGSDLSWRSLSYTNYPQSNLLDRSCLTSQNLPDWHEIVNAYATRKSSLPSDKLTALSALADIYRRHTGHTYCAGLWKEALLQDLCWRNPGENLLPRPKAYRAPSFSWAAIDANAHGKTKTYHRSRHGYNARTEILGVAIEQEHPNTTYGKILGGSLTLKAPILWINWKYDECAVTNITTKYWGVLSFIRDAKEDDWLIGDNVRLLAVSLWGTHYEYMGTFLEWVARGLMLVEASNGMFRRIGVFDGETAIKYEFAKQTVTII